MSIYIRSGVDFEKPQEPYSGIVKGAMGSNLGNMLFQKAVWNVFSSNDKRLIPIGHDLYKHQARKINHDGEMLVLPLANIFRNEFKEKIDSYTALIKQLKVPVVVVGAGCQTDLNYNTSFLEPINNSVKKFVSAILDRSNSIGVRGECTYNYLLKLGFTDVDIIGCPSMYSAGEIFPATKPLQDISEKTRFAINISSKIRQCEFSSGLDVAASFLDKIVAANPEAVLFPQEQRTLESYLWGASKTMHAEYSLLSEGTINKLMARKNIKLFYEPSGWVNHLKQFDLCIGSRIHGNIAGLLAGTPCIVIAHDSRSLELSQFHGISYITPEDIKSGFDIKHANNFYLSNTLHKKHRINYANYCSFLSKNNIPIPPKQMECREGVHYMPLPDPVTIDTAQSTNLSNQRQAVRVRRYIYKTLRKYGYFNVV